MEKNNCQNYSLLDFFNIPYPESRSKVENKANANIGEVYPLPTSSYIEIQLSLFDDVNK